MLKNKCSNTYNFTKEINLKTFFYLCHPNSVFMKSILLSVSLFFGSYLAVAAPVDVNTAQKVGANFLKSETTLPENTPLTLTSTSMTNGVANYYVFSGDHCFVIVSADDRIKPVLGYSTESGFDMNRMSKDVNYFLGTYSSQISYSISNQLVADVATTTEWGQLINATYAHNKTETLVSPLCKTTWDQLDYYDAKCPYDYSFQQQTVTGCVATAMAQVLKYWDYPKTGTGSLSYSDNQYGTLSAAFAKTTYDWSAMPNSVTATSDAVATLMFHCGVSVKMNYGLASNDGSSAYVISNNGANSACAENALKNYWNYAATLQGVQRSSYTNAAWLALIEKELDNKRPIIYSGFESTGAGHCFVFDGYNSSHPYFHINWGWSGAFNGFFSVDALVPGGVGTGGGTGDFTIGQAAIIGIQPADPNYSHTSGIENVNTVADLGLYPNPANDNIHIVLPQPSSKPVLFTVLDMQGKQVFATMPVADNNNGLTVNTSTLPVGMYLVRVTTNEQTYSSRLVVNR